MIESQKRGRNLQNSDEINHLIGFRHASKVVKRVQYCFVC